LGDSIAHGPPRIVSASKAADVPRAEHQRILANDLSAPVVQPAVAVRPQDAGSLAAPRGALPALAPVFEQLRTQPRLPLILGAAVVATALAGGVLWSRTPDYKVLYANVSDRDGGAIIASLQQMNVPYKLAEGGGAILVAADQVSETRLKLAAQGLPKAGGVGFELLDNQKFGTSQFAEQVNYQRGLEGELARSIETIGSVHSARVHLALPKPSLFVREQKKPSASVVLTLQSGRAIDEGQVSAIVHLVSSSVPDLEARSVTVVDQRGNLLSAASGGTRGLDTTQLKYVEDIEQSYVRRIETILQPLLGAGNVRAQVAADVDFSVVEATDEKYHPNQDGSASAIRSQQTSESTQQGVAPTGGIPGALSNQPAPAATAPLNAASGAKAAASGATTSTRAASGNSRRDVTTNYEVDRSIRHTQQGAGATRRLSVAVVVNNREVHAANGKTSLVPLTPAELQQVTSLVKEAMGFDAARGDSVNVVNSAFTVENTNEAPVPFWKDAGTLELARTAGRYLFILAGLLFAWLAVLRPLQRRQAAPAAVDARPAVAGTAVASGAAPALAPQQPASIEDAASVRRKADIEYAQHAAAQDPRLVASLIRHWMTA
jgi:flagellar M-ring protein FliF